MKNLKKFSKFFADCITYLKPKENDIVFQPTLYIRHIKFNLLRLHK